MIELEITEENYRHLPKILGFHINEGINEFKLLFKSTSPDIMLLKKYILHALEHELHAGIMLLDVPFCIMPEADDHIINGHSAHKSKTASCTACRYGYRCGGLWKSHLKRYKTQLIPAADTPEEIVMELTSHCNLSCTYCFNKTIYPKAKNYDLDIDVAKDVIEQAASLNIQYIRFSGGEPMLYPGLIDLMQYASSKGLKIKLNTNGTLLTEGFIAKAENLVENVLVPLNSYNKAMEKKITGKDCFNKKIASLRLLQKSKIPIVRVGTMATNDIIGNIDRLFNIIKKLAIEHWEFYRPVLLSSNDKDMDHAYISRLTEKIIKYHNQTGLLFPIANALPFCSYDPNKLNFISLGAKYDDGHTRLIVDPRGHVRPSYFIDKNTGTASDISACWNHRFMKDMRQLRFIPTECEECFYKFKCRGGSRYFSNLFFGCYNSPDPLAHPKNNKLFKAKTFS